MDEPTKYICTFDDLDLLLDKDLKKKFWSLFYEFPNNDSTESELIDSSESQLVDSSATNIPIPRPDAWRLWYVSAKECEKVYEERTGQKIIREPGESDEEWKQRWKRLLSPIMQELGNERILAFFKQFGIDYDKPTVRDAVAFDLVKLDDYSVSNDSTYTYEEHVGYSPSEYERYLLHKNFRVNLVNLAKDWSDITYDNESGQEVAPKRKRTEDKVFQGARLSDALLDYFSKVMEAGATYIITPTGQ